MHNPRPVRVFNLFSLSSFLLLKVQDPALTQFTCESKVSLLNNRFHSDLPTFSTLVQIQPPKVNRIRY